MWCTTHRFQVCLSVVALVALHSLGSLEALPIISNATNGSAYPDLAATINNTTFLETQAAFLATPTPEPVLVDTVSSEAEAKVAPVDTTYYSLIRLNIEGDVPEGTTLEEYLQQQVKLYVATYGAQVSSLVLDYVTQILTNNVDPGSGLSGNHRRLMETLGGGTELAQNTTAVIVALQSQSWTNMQAVTAGVNAQNLAQTINGRKVLQVSAVSSTVSYTLPGPAEALNFLQRVSPSLSALSGLQYNASTQLWSVRMRFVPEPGSFSALYVTRTNGYSAADMANPCVQPTATLCCVWDVMARYYTPALPLSNLSCSAALTAQQFFDSLGAQRFVDIDLPSLGIRSRYASPGDEQEGVVTVELAQGAVEQYVSTVQSTSLSTGVNRFGIGLLVIRPNPTSSPDAILDFSVFDVFSVNNFLLSVRSTQDYTVLSGLQASLHEVSYPLAQGSTARGSMYYANLNFVVPQAYRMVDTPGNIVAYLGTQQLPFSQTNAWQSPCGVYGNDPNSRLEDSCRSLSTLNFCHPIQHNFLGRPGIDINLQIPFNPDLSVPGLTLYVSVLVQLQDPAGVSPPVFTNVVLSVPLTGFIKHCVPVVAAAATLPNNYINVVMRTGLEEGAGVTEQISRLAQSLGIDSAPVASYSIDLTGGNVIRSITDSLITIKLEGFDSYFTANPSLQVYVDQVLTIHTLGNETRTKLKALIDSHAAYYTVPPSPGGSYTELVLTDALLELCQEGVPGNGSDCTFRWEIRDRITVNPFYAHRVKGTDEDVSWLKTVIGTSQLASQVAINVTQYQGLQGGADPRYNSVVWLYPAYAWPGRALFYLTDYVFAAVAFSVQSVGQPTGTRRLLAMPFSPSEEEEAEDSEKNEYDEEDGDYERWLREKEREEEEEMMRKMKEKEKELPVRPRSMRRPHLQVVREADRWEQHEVETM